MARRRAIHPDARPISAEEMQAARAGGGIAPPPRKPRRLQARGRSTVPYTEPGPTMHENFRVLQEEAEGAYELLGELAPILGNIAASAFPEPGRALDALNRVRAHLKTYEERYRKQGGDSK